MTRLVLPVGKRDHLLGEANAPITLVEYGSYECSHCAQAERVVSQLQRLLNGNMRYVYRHFPSGLDHSTSRRAAEAAEAAGAQGKFWEMHGLLLENAHNLNDATIAVCAAALDLNVPYFLYELNHGAYAEKVREDFLSGLQGGVNGTPTFFINSIRHDDYWDIDTLLAAVENSLAESEEQFAQSAK